MNAATVRFAVDGGLSVCELPQQASTGTVDGPHWRWCSPLSNGLLNAKFPSHTLLVAGCQLVPSHTLVGQH